MSYICDNKLCTPEQLIAQAKNEGMTSRSVLNLAIVHLRSKGHHIYPVAQGD